MAQVPTTPALRDPSGIRTLDDVRTFLADVYQKFQALDPNITLPTVPGGSPGSGGGSSGGDADTLNGRAGPYYQNADNLNAGTLPGARFTDTSHGDRGGGTLHADVAPSGADGFMTGTDKARLDGIEDGADVTDAANVDAAGAVMDADFSGGLGLMHKLATGSYEVLKTNLTAVVEPAVTDDSAGGYAVGSRWIVNGASTKEFVCLDASVGAAIWKLTTRSTEGRPSDVIGLGYLTNAQLIELTWVDVSDEDLAGYVGRYGVTGVTWENARPLADGVVRATSYATIKLPPGDWDVLIKAEDISGLVSLNAARVSISIVERASLALNTANHPTWPGTLNGFVIHTPTGKLLPEDDRVLSSYSTWAELGNWLPNPVASSIYTSPEYTLAYATKVLIWITSVETIAPGLTGDTSILVEVRIDPDGTGYGSWETWEGADSRTVKKMQWRMTSDNTVGVAILEQMTVKADDLSVPIEAADVTIDPGGTTIVFSPPFLETPVVQITPEDGLVGGWTSKSNLQVAIHLRNTSGTDVGGLCDYSAYVP